MKVIIVAAMTADGFIGNSTNHRSTAWTNKEDRYLFTHLVKDANNMVMGLTTFMTIAQAAPGVFNKTMPGRRLLVYTHNPDKVSGYQNVEAVNEDPATLVKQLESEGVKTLAVCGGSQIYTAFMRTNLVNELYIDMQATLFGRGVPLFNEPLTNKITLHDSKPLGPNNILLHYTVN